MWRRTSGNLNALLAAVAKLPHLLCRISVRLDNAASQLTKKP